MSEKARERTINYAIDKNGTVKIVFDEKIDELVMSADQLRAFADRLFDVADEAEGVEPIVPKDLPAEKPARPRGCGDPLCVACALVVLSAFADALDKHLDDDEEAMAFDSCLEPWQAVLEVFEPFYAMFFEDGEGNEDDDGDDETLATRH